MLTINVYLQPVYNADFVIPVEIDGTVHQVSNHTDTSAEVVSWLLWLQND